MPTNAATAAATAPDAGALCGTAGKLSRDTGARDFVDRSGTFLGESDAATDAAYEEAIRTALIGGINLLDTAVNYRFQRSERAIGRVPGRARRRGQTPARGNRSRDQGGYVTFDGAMPADPRQWFEEKYIKSGIGGARRAGRGRTLHGAAMARAMLDRAANLGLETIDVYYLHNPESQLGAVSREEFIARLRAAFELLERKVGEGLLAYLARRHGTAFAWRRAIADICR